MSRPDNLPPVVQRFLRYASYDTQSADGTDQYPSTDKQKVLGKLLVEELQALGITDAAMDEHGYVMGTVPANVETDVPVIGLIAHVDTSPEVSGKDVRPQIHADYDGGPIVLNAEHTLTPEQSPELKECKGQTVITSDGSTLLGADNKAGVAEIITLVERLRDDPKILHGKVRIGFTCDEEVGRGTDHFDVKKFGAKYAYTVDGEGPGEIDNETFCVGSAAVTFTGVNVHPGYAKDKLVNAIKATARFVELLPTDRTPETTENREGFVHPMSVSGGVEQTTLKLILRDFEEEGLRRHHELVNSLAEQVRQAFPKVRVDCAFEESYRNMRFVLDQHPDTVAHAVEAARRAGLTPRLNLIRGGTDGARLSYAGVPTPNVFTGGHLFHSRYEWITVEGMQAAVETLVQLVQTWEEKSR